MGQKLTAVQVYERYGKIIHRACDCDQLAIEIEWVTGRAISSTTLRRFFGLMKSKCKLSSHNQQTLEMYVQSTLSFNQPLNHWAPTDQETINDLIGRLVDKFGMPNASMAQFLLLSRINSSLLLEVIRKLIVTSVKEQRLNFLLGLYQSNNTLLENQIVFRTLGNALKEVENSSDVIFELSKLPVARRKLFEQYVDIGNFVSYRPWLESYLVHEDQPAGKAWGHAVMSWGDILSGNSPNFSTLIKMVEEHEQKFINSHPYLVARVFGVLLCSPEKHSRAVQIIRAKLIEEQKHLFHFPFTPPLFSVLVFQYLIVSQQQELAKLLLQNLQNYQPTKSSSIDYGMNMTIKLARCFRKGEGNFTIYEVKYYDSGYTSEDVVVKYFGAAYACDNEKRKAHFQDQLIYNSGFSALNQLITPHHLAQQAS